MFARFRGVVLSVLAVTVLVGGALAYAQGPGPGGRGMRGPGMGIVGGRAIVELRNLDLSEAQRQQVRQVMDQHREATRATVERLRAAREALQAVSSASVFNEGEIRAAARQVGEVEADLAVERARLQADIRALLTPEQIQELETRRAERETRLRERRQRMQEGRQN